MISLRQSRQFFYKIFSKLLNHGIIDVLTIISLLDSDRYIFVVLEV